MRFYRRENDRNYLRVRGEYREEAECLGLSAELPPRTRRIQSSVVEITSV